MAWISVHESVIGHKLRGLKKRINCSECEALGILTKLWLWSLNNTNKDGMLLNTSKDDIAELFSASLSGKLKPCQVADLLISERWIDELEGNLYIHEWSEWQAYWLNYQEKKEKDRLRKHANSGKSEEIKPDIPVENPTDNETEVPQQFHGNSTENLTQTKHNITKQNNDIDNSNKNVVVVKDIAAHKELQPEPQDVPQGKETYKYSLNQSNEALKTIQKYYEQHIGNLLSPTAVMKIIDFLNAGVESALICKAIDRSIDSGARNWNYAEKTVNNCICKNILTLEQYEKSEVNRNASSSRTNRGVNADGNNRGYTRQGEQQTDDPYKNIKSTKL